MFVELVCGPPGSGKSTYCEGKRQFLDVTTTRASGNSSCRSRRVATVNLDPANDGVFPYPCDVDVGELVSHEVVMETEKLGPNGAYLFCAEVLASDDGISWIRDQILKYTIYRAPSSTLGKTSNTNINSSGGGNSFEWWVIIDCPGQVEFYLNNDFMRRLVKMLQKELRAQVCMVHLTDASTAIRDVGSYTSACLLTLCVLVDLELPQVNVLSKWDMVAPSRKEQKERARSERRARRGIRDCDDDESSSNEDEDEDPENALVAPTQRDDEVPSYFLDASQFFDNHFKRLWKAQDREKRRENEAAQRHTERQRLYSSSGGKENHTAEENKNNTSEEQSYTSSMHYRLSHSLFDVIDGYGLVGYSPLDVQDANLMLMLCHKIDEAIGYAQ